MSNEIQQKDLYNDKVQISVSTLIEIKRVYRCVIKDPSTYIHKVFPDDNVFGALDELEKTWSGYFNEPREKWLSSTQSTEVLNSEILNHINNYMSKWPTLTFTQVLVRLGLDGVENRQSEDSKTTLHKVYSEYYK